MVPLFGAAGGEAADAIALMISYGGLLLLAIIVGIALMASTRTAAIFALGAVLGLSMLFLPCVAFRPYGSADPDVRDWDTAWGTVALLLGLVVAAAVAVTVRAFLSPSEGPVKALPQPEESYITPHH